MRAWAVLAVFFLLLWVPTAFGQGNDGNDIVVVTVEPTSELLEPLGKSVSTPFHARVACNARTASGATLVFDILVAPPWANAAVSPGSASFGAQDCVGASRTFDGVVTVRANQTAPAFSPSNVVVIAYATGAGNLSLGTAQGTTTMTAAYVSSLELVAGTARKVASEEGVGRFTVEVFNHGNGRTNVEWSLSNVSAGLDVAAPPSLEVESRFGGGSNAETVPIVARRSATTTGELSFTLTASGHYAGNASLVGDEQSVTLWLEAPRALTTPAPALAGAVIALALAAFTLRRRRA